MGKMLSEGVHIVQHQEAHRLLQKRDPWNCAVQNIYSFLWKFRASRRHLTNMMGESDLGESG